MAKKQSVSKKRRTSDSTRGYPIKLVRSGIHGKGVVASEPIAAGQRIIEYTGERISNAEADRRYPFDENKAQHTFLFSVNARTIIDAASGGNVARFINHSCDPNCEAVIERGRVFIEALRAIEPGEELGYDYWFVLDEPHSAANRKLYVCNCGAKNCRGTMLADKRKARAYLSY
ncbi:MAG: SET domain-containing protein [Gemmatimonadota bacterium]